MTVKAHQLLLCLALITMAACGPSPERQAAMTATALTAIAAAWTATPSATPTLTSTPTPIPTPTPTLTPTITPTPTSDPNRYYPPDNTFSLIPPEGWMKVDRGLDYPSLRGPLVGRFAINLAFYQDRSNLPVEMYAAAVQHGMKTMFADLSLVSEGFRTTFEGLDYFRWEYTYTRNGAALRQIMYIFGPGDWKLVITYSRPKDQGSEYDAAVDAAIRTVHYERADGGSPQQKNYAIMRLGSKLTMLF